MTKDLTILNISRQNIPNNIFLTKPKPFGIVSRCTLSTFKDFIDYTCTNTPPPPLSNVQSGEVFL